MCDDLQLAIDTWQLYFKSYISIYRYEISIGVFFLFDPTGAPISQLIYKTQFPCAIMRDWKIEQIGQ